MAADASFPEPSVAAGPTQAGVVAGGTAVTAEDGGAGRAGGGAAADASVCKQNIRMMFAFQVLNAVAWGVAMGPIFDRYLYYLGGGAAWGPTFVPRHARNSLVGMSESISGLTSLAAALPVGFLVDQWPDRRARLLRLSSIFGFAAGFLAIVAVLSDFMLLLYLTLVFLGIFSELAGSASEAIFADSIPQGQRAGIFTTKAILSTVGAACGPGFSMAGLWFLGDQWKAYQMKAVIVVGSLLMPISCAALFFFRDPAAAAAAQPGAEGAEEAAAEGPSAPAIPPPGQRCGRLGPRHVPVFLAGTDFVSCIGAGMTVKFFNLFFIQDQKFTPVQICALQTAYPLMIAIFMKGTERLARPLGRPQASLLFFGSSAICLVLLSRVHNLSLLLAVYLVRGGLANSVYPIDRSILMDFTPSTQRGRWNAVESLTSMTWSGSAFVGGLLSDSHDYRFTFLITALVYTVACLIYAPLLWLVPRREGQVSSAGDGAAHEVPLVSAGACMSANLAADGEKCTA